MRNVLIVNREFTDINPLISGEEQCAPGHSFGPASREFYLLHYVLSGKGVFYCGDDAYPVGRGQFFVIRPYEITVYAADEQEPWRYCWIGFSSQLDLDGLLDRPVIDAPGAEYLFRSIQDSDALGAAKELYICGKLFELFALLSKNASPGEAQTPEFILQAKTFIESNYVEPISVGGLAARLNLDRSYFSTAFRKSTGKSPQQYIVDFRLEKAAELLSVRGYRPGQAGQSVGYPDIFHFSRMFKRKYGLSPSEYADRRRRAGSRGRRRDEPKG